VQLPIYQVDAFTAVLFGGNPAAVMPLDEWLDDTVMQAIAAENNLSETAFLVAEGEAYGLRWFTPEVEIALCGHATLASAHVLFEHLGHPAASIVFETRSGELRVARGANGLTLDFPAYSLESTPLEAAVVAAMGGAVPAAAWQTTDGSKLMLVYANETQVAALRPDYAALQRATPRNVIATAPGDACDFVSRFFAPGAGIDEDPVTGSAHCALVPYWSGQFGRERLQARQISARGGELSCELRAGRVLMTGRAVTFMRGEVSLPVNR